MRATPERRAPVAMCQQSRLPWVADVEQREAAVTPGAGWHGVGNDGVVQSVAIFAGVPSRRFAAGLPHPRQPPTTDLLWLGRVGHVDDHEDVIGEALELSGDIRIPSTGVPDPMQAQAADGHEATFAWVGRIGNVENAQPSSEVA